MFAYLWLSLLLIKVSGVCYEECNASDASSCSRCLSYLSKNALKNTNPQAHLICNLWDSPECWMGWYNIKVDQEQIKIKIELPSGQKEILITKLGQELKMASTEFIIPDEEKMKQPVEFNCSSSYLPGDWQSFGFALKPEETENSLIIWLIGRFSENQNSFKGFIDIEITMKNFLSKVSCAEIPEQAKSDCKKNCEKSCAPWLVYDTCVDTKRNLACSDYTYKSAISMGECPTGISPDANTCECKIPGDEIFNIVLKDIADPVVDSINHKNVFVGPADETFYPTYNSNSHYASESRGYYFSGSKYMRLPPNDLDPSANSINFAPDFSISVWIYTHSSTSGYILVKRSSGNSDYYLVYSLNINCPYLTLSIGNPRTLETRNAATTLGTTQWYNIGFSVSYTPFSSSEVKFYINGVQDPAYTYSGFFNDSFSGYSIWIGSDYDNSGSPIASLSDTFIYSIRMWNAAKDLTNTDYSASGCSSSCSFCLNDGTCLTAYGIGKYYDSETSSWLSCTSGEYLIAGVCSTFCPLGYTANSETNNCDANDSTLALNLIIDSLSGVITETSNSLNIISGTSSEFYTSHDNKDPMAAYKRGYYFDGSTSLMHLTPYNSYTTPLLTIAPQMTIQVWVNPDAGGTLISKVDSSFVNIFTFSIIDSTPTIKINLAINGQKTFACMSTIRRISWNHIGITMKLDPITHNTALICTVNGVADTSSTDYETDYFIDTATEFYSTIGALQTAASVYINYYKGFIYKILIDNSYSPSTSDYQTSSCSGGCSACPAAASTCLPTFYISKTAEARIGSSCSTGCDTCTDTSHIGCSACSTGYYMISGLCRTSCPYGYTISGQTCSPSDTLFFDLLLTKIQGVVYDTKTLIPAVTGSTDAFYPSFDSDDPYPAYLRGYHFDGTSSIMHLPSFSTYTSPDYIIAPEFTFTIWINPEASTGYLLAKQDSSNSYNEIFSVQLASSTPKMTIYLQLVGTQVMTCENPVILNSWNHIGFKININSSGNTLVTCYVNGVADSSATDMGFSYFDDITSNIAAVIGAKQSAASSFTSYFKGFIYEITTDNAANSAISSILTSGCLSGCSVCPSSGNCIPNCPISHFWAGTSDTDCTSCSSSCNSKGCIRADNKCSLCKSQQCTTCTDYSSDCTDCVTHADTLSSSSCACSATYTWDSTNEICAACDSTCSACTAVGYMYCSSCATNYYALNGACHPYCPTGYTSVSGICTLNDSLVFDLKPNKIEAVVTDLSSGNVKVLAGSSTDFYPNYDDNDPYPIQNRGYYFTGQSIMTLPPNLAASSPVIIFSNEFTIAAWLSHSALGILVSKQTTSLDTYIKITIDSTPSLEIYSDLMSASATHTCSNSLASNWNLVEFTVSLQANGNVNMLCRINGAADSSAEDMGAYYFKDTTSTSSIILIGGNYISSGTLGSFWTGILYELKIYNEYKSSSIDLTSTCSSGGFTCSSCPASTAACINTCAFNEWWDGSACKICGCGSKSCVRADVVCNLCDDQQCSKCSDFIANTCSECITNAEVSGNDCVCKSGTVWDSATDTCATCEGHCSACTGINYLDCTACKSPYYWFHSICLSSCPTGYTANAASNSCDVDNDLVLSYNFDTISGTVTDQSSFGIKMRTGSTTNFYPTYDSDDPWATYKRGFYFSAADNSYVILSPFTEYNTAQLTLGSDFTIAIWVRPAADGTLIAKQGNSASVPIYFVYEIVSSEPKLTVSFVNLMSTVTVDSSGATLNLNTWSHVSYTLNFQTSVGTVINSYINAALKNTHTTPNDYFLDATSSYLFTIGAAWSDQTTRTNFYEGFIYELKIWNNIINTDSGWGITNSGCTSNPTSCTYCPSAAATCLPECDITEFYDPTAPSCGNCKGSCTTGCLNANYCNLCDDPVCSVCTDFGSTSCTSCKTDASGASGSCVCGNAYYWDTSSETCMLCGTGKIWDSTNQVCAPCKFYCSACISGKYLIAGVCHSFCPLGYDPDSTNNACTAKSSTLAFKFNFNLLSGVITESSMNQLNVITGNSDDFYLNYDNEDPIAAYKRGYYFDGSTSKINLAPFLSYSTPLLTLAPQMTIQAWVNPSSDGILISKVDSSFANIFTFSIVNSKPTIQIKMFTNGQKTFTCTNALIPGWNHIMITIKTDSAAPNTAQICTLNGNAESSIDYGTDYFMDSATGFYSTIGALKTSSTYTNLYTGFIYEIIIDNSYSPSTSDYQASSCSGGCTFCPAATQNCLPTCTIDKYWTGGNYDACSSCDSHCLSKGCRENGPICNLCTDIICSVCSEYDAVCTTCLDNASLGSNSKCECNNGYVWDSTNQVCTPCKFYCSACISGKYLIAGVCHSFCPLGYDPDNTNNACTAKSSTLAFKFNFNLLSGAITESSMNQLNVVTGNSDDFYLNYDNEDPIAAYKRGYYFDGSTSKINLAPFLSYSTPLLTLAPQMTIQAWVNPSSDGILISKVDSSFANIFTFSIVNSKPTVQIKMFTNGQKTFTCTNALIPGWNHIMITIKTDSAAPNTAQICTLNGNAESSIDYGTDYFMDSATGFYSTIGALKTSSTYTNLYTGFIYEIIIDNSYSPSTSDYQASSCSGGCTFCPAATQNCLPACTIDKYWTGGNYDACSSCDSHCLSKGCRENGPICNLCTDIICSVCSEYDAVCTTCLDNASLGSNSKCECNNVYVWDSTNQVCTPCKFYCSACISGKYLIAGVCHSFCPLGYDPDNTNNACTAKSSTLAFKFNFNLLSGVITESSMNQLNVVTGNSDDFYPNYDNEDPIAAYKRGYYFDGSTSKINLAPFLSYSTPLLTLAPQMTIQVWVNPSSDGILISKVDSSFANIFTFSILNSKPTIQIKMFTNGQKTFTCTNTIISGWNHIMITIKTDSAAPNTAQICTLNGNAESSIDYGTDYFMDTATGFYSTIGALKTSSTYTNLYTGFIYEIIIDNSYSPSTSDYQASSCSGGCTFCPAATQNCLPACTIDKYWTGSNYDACSSCDSHCLSKGCREDGPICNLCTDIICSVCSEYDAVCTTCLDNASLGSNSKCECNNGYVWDSTNQVCTPCKFYCSACISGKYLIAGVCHSFCPLGYDPDNTNNACTAKSSTLAFKFNFNLLSGVITESSMNQLNVVTGNSDDFYPNYDNEDPIAAYKRGYYFDGSTSKINLAPFLSYSTPLLTLAPQMTIQAWVNPSSDGILISKVDSSFANIFTFSIVNSKPTIQIKMFTNGQKTFTCTNTIISGWNHIMITIKTDSAAPNTAQICTLNGNAESSIDYGTDYFMDTATGFYSTIGALKSSSAYTSYYTGFIYEIIIDNSYSPSTSDYQASSCSGGCTFCPAATQNCLPACTIDKYWTGGNYDACSSCDSHCLSKGCREDGPICNLCTDIICSVCSEYDAVCTTCLDNASLDSSSKCACNNGYIWDSTNQVCTECKFYCSACVSGKYLIAGVCHSFCPLGYDPDNTNNECTAKSSTLAFKFNFNILSGVIIESSLNQLNIFTGNSDDFYPDYDNEDPIAAYERGYYFDGSTSKINLAPYNSVSTPLLTLAPQMTIQAWVNPSSDGILISKVDSSFANIFTFSIVNSKPTIQIKMFTNGQKTSACTNSIISGWNHIMITIKTDSATPNTALSFTLNGVAESSIDYGTDYFMDISTGFYSTIGSLKTSSTYTNLYTGFIYEIIIDNSYSPSTSDYQASSCSGGCSACPLATQNCIPTCTIGQYQSNINYNSCAACNNNCLSKGCRENGEICNLCTDIICSVCSEYDAVCTTCLDNASLDSNNQCACNDQHYWNTTHQICASCDASCFNCDGGTSFDCLSCTGSYYLNGECWTACPNGYTQSGSICISNIDAILALTFDKIQDTITDSEQSIVALTGNNNNFYPTYDTYDPLATYERGYYFSGSTYIQLPPYSGSDTPILYIGTDNTFATWIWPTATAGTIFSKQTNTATVDSYYTISLSGYYPMITLSTYKSSNWGKVLTASYICPTAITNGRWYYIVIQTTYSTSTKTTTANCYIDSNTAASNEFVSAGKLKDSQTNYLNDIGAAHTDQSTFGSFIRAFIYSVKLWNTLESSPTTVDRLTSCTGQGGCSQCPKSGTCLSLCTLSQYWDTTSASCKSCHSNCNTKGCVRYDQSCNLCASQICYKCTDFTSCPTTGTPCIADASVSPCACNPTLYFSTTTETCVACSTGCDQCTDATHKGCTSCSTGYYLLSGLCRDYCPLGYSESGQTCSPTDTLFFDLLLMKIQGVVYDSKSSIPAVTGSTDAFYPSYDDDDPYPAYLRGYHFDGTKSIMHLPSFDIYSEPNYVMAPQFTFTIWINPEAATGYLLAKQDPQSSYDEIFSVQLASRAPQLTIYLHLVNTKSMTCENLVDLNSWNHIGFEITINSAGNTLVTCYVNGVADSSPTDMGFSYFDDITSSFVAAIGAKHLSAGSFTSYFTGFIYEITTDNAANSAISSILTSGCSSGCSVCPSSGNCIPNCPISQFWTGTSDTDCTPCSSSCSSLGCVRTDSKCSLCKSQQCATCTDYSSDCIDCITHADTLSSSSCACSTTYIWDSTNEICAACDSTCSTCTDVGYMYCSSCATNYYFLNGACHPYCPTGYIVASGTCTMNNSPAFYINPSKIEAVVTDLSGESVKVLAGLDTDFYPNYDSNDPYPIQNRGYYFTGQSIMTLPPNSAASTPVFKFGNEFTIAAWISHSAPGILVSKQTPSLNSYIKMTIDSTPSLEIYSELMSASATHTCSNSLVSDWNLVEFTISLQSNGHVNMLCRINGVADTLAEDMGTYYFKDTTNASPKILIGGNYISPGTLGNFWTGILYELKIYNEYKPSCTDLTSTCTSGDFACSYCPASTAACINTCAFDHWWNGSTCQACGCGSKPCVRADVTCNLCDDQKCSTCSDFIANTCSDCITNAEFSGNDCVCKSGFLWDSSTESCVSCDVHCSSCTGASSLDCTACKSPYYWFHSICLSSCPTGYTANTASNSCDVTNDLVLSYNFDTISGTVTDQGSFNIQMRTGSTTAFYPTYDTDDPWATYKRGFYFSAADNSYVILSPFTEYNTAQLTLGSDFTIAIWVRPAADGTLIAKQGNSASVPISFVYEIVSSEPKLTVSFVNLMSTVTVDSSGATLTLNTWSHISYTLNFQTSVGTVINSYINAALKNTHTTPNDYFLDATSSYLFTIGAAWSDQTTHTNFYEGFIYELKIWNNIINTDSGWGITSSGCTSNPTSCTYCPSATTTCLPECGITEYYDPTTPSCGNCKGSCTTGCLNANYCTLCYDPVCSDCTDFGPTSCQTCKNHASKPSGTCVCGNPYFWDTSSETCMVCATGCDACTSQVHNSCTKCLSNYYMTLGECLDFCPYGFTADTTNWVCNSGIGQIFAIDFSNKILGSLTDSISGFKLVTGSSTSFYPNYDSDDPLAADARGYYFNGASVVHINANSAGKSLTFPSKITFSIWVNPSSDGTIFSKQDQSTIKASIILAWTNGKMNILITLTSGTTYSVSSAATLTTSTWWHIAVQIKILSDGYTAAAFILNGATDSTTSAAVDYLNDNLGSFTIALGAQYVGVGTLGTFFQGFIYTMKIWQDVVTSYSSEMTTTGCSGCSVCLASTSCIVNCAYNKYWDGSACQSCSGCSSNTCIKGTTCNLCYDILCNICTDYTSTGCTSCSTNSHFSSGTGSACECNSGYIYISTSQSCVQCPSLCSSCTSIATTGCTTCASGAYRIQGVCMPYCPTGFTAGSGTCNGVVGLVFDAIFIKIQGTITDSVKGITITTGSTSAFYPTYDLDDPYPSQYRGYYFNGLNSVMNFVTNSNNNLQLVFSPKSTIGMWINPSQSSGTIFSKQDSTSAASYLDATINSSGFPVITINVKGVGSSTYTCGSSLYTTAWNFFGFTVTISGLNSYIQCTVNSHQDSSQGDLGTGFFEDLQSLYTFTLGAQNTAPSTLGSYYKGFIYEMKAWSNSQSLSSEVWTSCSGCSVCPSSTKSCIVNCPITTYYSSGCSSCSGSCTKGCVRNSDCNLCNDSLCYKCTDFAVSTCTQCIANAALNSMGVCQCTGSAYYDTTTLACTACFSNCESCTNKHNGDCSTCNPGYYISPEGNLCTSSCPIGYTASTGACAANMTNSLVVHYEFKNISNNVADLISKKIAYMGSSSNYLGNFDSNDPYPILHLGLYFTGSSYVQLPPNSEDSSSIQLGNTHSILIWARPLSNTQNLYLFAKEGSGNIKAGLYIDQTTKVPTCKYRIYNDQTSSSSTLTATATALSAWDVWHNFAIVVQRIGYATQAIVYVDGTGGTISSIANSFLDDLTSDTFTVGQSISLSQSFLGYLYEIKIYNYAITPPTPSFSCGCTACTADNDCLTSCTYLQYYSGTCINCDASCTTGCVRSGNCKLNLDALCDASTLTGFAINECTGCINLASGAGSQCSCVEHSAYDSSADACVCSTNYMQYLTQCAPCYYHLQASDISATFTSTYKAINFTMSQAVQTSMPSACASLFDSPSYSSLGVSPTCAWASDMLSLLVTLGVNATVTTGPLEFKAMTLYTNTATCGALPSPVSVNIQSTYTKPEIIPVASLIAPIELYLECNDLSLDGTSSSGGYNRPLQYKWTVSASPDVPALNGDGNYNYTTGRIAISKEKLIASSTNITLTVLNWLGFSASTTQSLSLIYGKGLKLVFDTNINYVVKTSQSKSISVRATSGCEMSDTLSYEWKLTNSTGTVYESRLWSAQTIASTLFCPTNTFSPGTYTFEISVTDLINSLTGKAQFSLIYVASDLIVTVSNPLITIKSTSILSVSPSVTDPDKEKDTLSYAWTCSLNNSNCTSLIKSPTSLTLSLSGNTLQAGNYYIFTFTASKSTRSTSTTINVDVVSYTPAAVTFSSIPKYVNYQENFVIWAYPVITESYTCLWTMTTGGTYTLMGSKDSTSIGFLANTLTPGATYNFLFTVTTSTVVSKFKVPFTVSKPPTGGSLSVTPSQGAAYSTVFYIDAPGWSSSSSIDPLTYQFGFYNGTLETPLNVKNESSFLYVTLPYITPMTLFVKVYDEYGSYTLVSNGVTISRGDTTASSLLSTAQSSLSNSYTDSSTLIMLTNSLNSFIISNKSSSAADIQSAASTSLSAIERVVSSLPTIDAQNTQTVLNLLSGVTSSQTAILNGANQQTLFSTTTALLGEIMNNNVKMTTSQIKTCTSMIAQASGVNSTSIKNNPSVLSSTNQLLTDLYVAGASSMALGQTITSDSTYVHSTVQMLSPADLAGYKTTANSSYYGSFTFPANASVIIDGVKSMLTIFIIYDNPKGQNNATTNHTETYSRGLEFKVIEILPSGNVTLSLDFSPSYANLTIPYYSAVNKGETIQCVYYNNNAWSTSGCEYVNYTYPEVSCRCSHTSLFSAGINLATVTPNNTAEDAPSKDAWEGTFYYICSLAGGYVIMAFIFIFIDSTENKKLSSEKINAIKLHNQIYKETPTAELDNFVRPIKRRESDEIESSKPMFYKRNDGHFCETMPESADNLGKVSYWNKKKIVPETIVKNEDKPRMATKNKNNNEALKKNTPDYNIIVGPQKVKEINENDTYLKTSLNPLTAYYFISPFFFYMPFYSRLSRGTLLIFSLLLQAFFNGIFIRLYESGISSSKDYGFIEISQDIDYIHIIFAIFSPVFSNILAISIGWIFIKRRIKIRSDIKEALKQETINRLMGVIGYLVCLAVIGFIVVAAYWITQKIDGNGDMMWMVMIIISLLCDIAVIQVIKVIVTFIQHKSETHL